MCCWDRTRRQSERRVAAVDAKAFAASGRLCGRAVRPELRNPVRNRVDPISMQTPFGRCVGVTGGEKAGWVGGDAGVQVVVGRKNRRSTRGSTACTLRPSRLAGVANPSSEIRKYSHYRCFGAARVRRISFRPIHQKMNRDGQIRQRVALSSMLGQFHFHPPTSKAQASASIHALESQLQLSERY
ncbi:hypothetical protein L1887_42356 [Cichorium endivia]|nr:hypothetical protein L1887_42356 [Cichorium endivia]